MPKIGEKRKIAATENGDGGEPLKPFWTTADGELVKLYQGDAVETLSKLPEKSVHCVVTSPPYWALRDYGTALWEGGSEDCDHKHENRGQVQYLDRNGKPGSNNTNWQGAKNHSTVHLGDACKKCGATRIDKQLGSEKTPEEFVAAMVRVFAEVHRVLRDDGTLWLNLGDSYAGGGSRTNNNGEGSSTMGWPGQRKETINKAAKMKLPPVSHGLKSGNLVGIPWRVALALQAYGWILRQDIIWCLSGGTWLYVRGAKGEGLIQLHDLARDDEWKFNNLQEMELWNGKKWTKILGISSSQRKGDEIELVLRSGERISCTPNHKFPTKELGLVEAKDLRVGDKLVRCRLPEPETPKDSEHIGLDAAWFAGLYLAEGCGVNVGKMVFAGHARETDREERVRRIAKAYGGTFQVVYKGNNQTIQVCGKVICAVVRELVSGKDAKTKAFSQSVWKYSNAFIESMMEGYLHGDGGKEPDQGGVRLGFCRNYNLERDLRTACARLGWALTLKPNFSTCSGKSYPSFGGEIRRTRSGHWNEKDREEIIEIRKSRCRVVYDIGVADAPNLFSTATGLLTHNSKPSPMPESVKNRCTKSHEYIFLFAKKSGYYYDAEAVREANTEGTIARLASGPIQPMSEGKKNLVCRQDGGTKPYTVADGRNKRSVWSVASEPYEGSHFACFPRKLIEPCILAGSSEQGCCSLCGSPYKRVTTEEKLRRERPNDYVKRTGQEGTGNSVSNSVAGVKTTTIGWEASCSCSGADVIPCTVLDPFIGSGTSCVVSIANGRRSIGIDLNPVYLRNNAIPRIEGALLSIPELSSLTGRIAERMDDGEDLDDSDDN